MLIFPTGTRNKNVVGYVKIPVRKYIFFKGWFTPKSASPCGKKSHLSHQIVPYFYPSVSPLWRSPKIQDGPKKSTPRCLKFFKHLIFLVQTNFSAQARVINYSDFFKNIPVIFRHRHASFSPHPCKSRDPRKCLSLW